MCDTRTGASNALASHQPECLGDSPPTFIPLPSPASMRLSLILWIAVTATQQHITATCRLRRRRLWTSLPRVKRFQSQVFVRARAPVLETPVTSHLPLEIVQTFHRGFLKRPPFIRSNGIAARDAHRALHSSSGPIAS